LAKGGKAPLEWCYVNNFQDSTKPRCLSFPAGRGWTFKCAMEALIQALKKDLPTQFESTKYLDSRAKIVEEIESKKKVLFDEVQQVARERGFGFKEDAVGFILVPLKDGQPLKEQEFRVIPSDEQKEYSENRKFIEGKMREFQSGVHALEHEAERNLQEMDRYVVKNLLDRRLDILKTDFKDLPEVAEYLNQVHKNIITHYKDFIQKDRSGLSLLALTSGQRQADLSHYQVNLIVEHHPDGGAPVVDESHPTYANLIGKIERKSHLGVVFTDFTEIRGGDCIQASGGFLILNALDLLRQPYAWDALKRVIQNRKVEIEDPGEFIGFSTTGLKPEPIPVDIKVILLGPSYLFHLLQAYEEDFPKIFKVKADFEEDLIRTNEEDQRYARFVAKICQEENLPHFNSEAVSEIIQQGLRLAERNDKLSLRLTLLNDLIREAAFWAKREEHKVVTQEDVEKALAKKRYRVNLPEQKIQEEIKEGTLMVDVEGETVGQVNGLSVHLLGESTFGRPCRITARTFVGTKGVIDIQREAELAGHIHSKGVMTLSGYLAGKFATAHPFALGATLTFEQTYSEVEGDSAAVTELAAILSSLANVPLRQYLAITGSVNQLGEIQPIGGVNEKIEGFFETCKKHGLTEKQGVIIPARNIKHLALRREVVEASEAGKFSIYGVNTVEDALELLTGIPAGEENKEGKYPEGTLFSLVSDRLEEIARVVLERDQLEEKT